MHNPIIRLKNVSLGYEGEAILDHVSLDIPAGIFLPFIGPNGAGKTTLLRAILGFIAPLKGEIITPFQYQPAGYVPQNKSVEPLFPVSVWDIVCMGLYRELGWWGKPRSEQHSRIHDILAELDLEKHANKNFRDLSGGMKQKTLIARALVSGAQVFIMDEPTSELDEKTEREIFKHLEKFVSEKQKTVLVAHHGLHRILAGGLVKEVCLVNHRKVEKMELRNFRPEFL